MKRVLLKLSGEALSMFCEEKKPITSQALNFIASEIRQIYNGKIQIAIVIGGGNIWRGTKDGPGMVDRVTSDNMGMLATVINAMALQSALENLQIATRVQTAVEISRVAEPFIRRKAIRHLEKKRVVIFAGGTGNPYFTTDTAAALRAAEIGADLLIKATQVDGVYTADPRKDSGARLIKEISYMEAISKSLKFMDASALTLCMENRIPIRVINLHKKGNISSVISGKNIGTLIK